MNNINIVKGCFSPTGTTRRIVDAITAGISTGSSETIDLTLPGDSAEECYILKDNLLILGAPVYGGRLPKEAVKRFSRLRGDKTPAVVVVVYGNRAFEDALLELKDLALERGFIPVAGAAFIGEHSYAGPEAPIAIGRPDQEDIARAKAFGKKIHGRLKSIKNANEEKPVEVPGNFPYKSALPPSDGCARSNMDICTQCGACVTVCPTNAISNDENYSTDINLCILCCACVKSCPENARYMDSERVKKATRWLTENFTTPKRPEMFI